MISIFNKYYYNEVVMKNMNKIALLSGVLLLSLMGCSGASGCYCLETSDTLTYYEGKCFQASYRDIVSTAYIINAPTNPEADPAEYKYDIEWNKSLNTSNFTFTGGLKQKRIIEVFWIDKQVLKVTFDGRISDTEATTGYLRANSYSFKALSHRANVTYIYATFAIGDTACLVDKPVQE